MSTITKAIHKLAGANRLPSIALRSAATAFGLVSKAGVHTGGISNYGTLGYEPGNAVGGAVTQLTSITTAVTLNKACGKITTVSSTLAAGVDAQFTLTNNCIRANDVVALSVKSYGGTADGIPVAKCVAVADGSCVINVHNQGAVTLDALMVINFVVLKGAQD